jgi:hypothetical protein
MKRDVAFITWQLNGLRFGIAGRAMSSIGRRFDRESSSVFSVISPTGGIRPPDRHRAKTGRSVFLSGRRLRGWPGSCHKPTFHGKKVRHHAPNSSSNAFACFKSSVSNPSVNQP